MQFGCASLAVVLLAQSVVAAPRHHYDFVMAKKNTTSMNSPKHSPTAEDTGSVMTIMVSPIPATPTPTPTPMDSSGMDTAMDTPTDTPMDTPTDTPEMSSGFTPTPTPMMPPMVTPVGLPTDATTPEDTPTETSGPETTAPETSAPETTAPTSEPTEEPTSTEPSSSSPSSTSSSKPNPSCATAYSLHKNKLRAIRHPMNLPPAEPVKRSVSGSCKPGTYACLSGPEGWQVCDVSGNYQFAGNCPSNTHCQTYPSTGGLLCLPNDC